ncbi:Unknown protein, partial [Striga hermonthica]
MKLLGWMHRKLMQNSTEPVKNDSTGNLQACFSSIPSVKRERSPNAFEPAKSYDEPFDFLSIGTFGTDLLLDTAPPTPTLPTPVAALTGQPIDITENDLDLISHELEKFLESEDAETAYNSSERSSKASVITLTDQGNLQLCPLQKYLLAAPVGLAEMGREEVKKTRTSLEELFKEGKKSVDDGPLLKKGEGMGGKGNVARLLKKFVKRLSPTSSDGTAGFNDDDYDDDAVFRPTKKKLSKKYLLAAPVGLAEMGREEVKKTRTSLEELFKEGKKSVDDSPPLKKGEGKGNVARLVKKLVTRLSPASSDGTAGFNDDYDDDAVILPTKKKLSKKLVKMFNKKVYPEEMAEKQILKVTKSSEKKNYNCSKDNHPTAHNNDDQSASSKSKKNNSGLFCTGLGRDSSPVNAGHWVKTDSD